jgi:hypothetical protein
MAPCQSLFARECFLLSTSLTSRPFQASHLVVEMNHQRAHITPPLSCHPCKLFLLSRGMECMLQLLVIGIIACTTLPSTATSSLNNLPFACPSSYRLSNQAHIKNSHECQVEHMNNAWHCSPSRPSVAWNVSHHHPSLSTCNTCKQIWDRCSPHAPKSHSLVNGLPSTWGYKKFVETLAWPGHE